MNLGLKMVKVTMYITEEINMSLTPFDVAVLHNCSEFGCPAPSRQSHNISALPGIQLAYNSKMVSPPAPQTSAALQPLATWKQGRLHEVTALKCQLGWTSKHCYSSYNAVGVGKYHIPESELTRQGFIQHGNWVRKYGIDCIDRLLSMPTMQENIMDDWLEHTYTEIIRNKLPINNTSVVNALGMVSVALRSTPADAVKWAITGVAITNTEIECFNQARYAIEVLLPALEG